MNRFRSTENASSSLNVTRVLAVSDGWVLAEMNRSSNLPFTAPGSVGNATDAQGSGRFWRALNHAVVIPRKRGH